MSFEPIVTIALGVWLGGLAVGATAWGVEGLTHWWRDRKHIQLQGRVRR